MPAFIVGLYRAALSPAGCVKAFVGCFKSFTGNLLHVQEYTKLDVQKFLAAASCLRMYNTYQIQY